MDINALKAELITDEGLVTHVYKDSRGRDTLCAGHLKTAHDHVRPGQPIPLARCHELLAQDIQTAIAACERLWPTFDALPQEAQHVLINVAFTLGEQKLKRFVYFHRAIEQAKWEAAARALEKSKWFGHVGARGKRLVARLRGVAS
jgi:GH24 family phage-related lysozyme (muramidase)